MIQFFQNGGKKELTYSVDNYKVKPLQITPDGRILYQVDEGYGPEVRSADRYERTFGDGVIAKGKMTERGRYLNEQAREYGFPDVAAVMRFQREHGLKVDGIIGKHTIAALNEVNDVIGRGSQSKFGSLEQEQRAGLQKFFDQNAERLKTQGEQKQQIMNGVAKDYGIPLSQNALEGVTTLRQNGIPAFPSTQTMGEVADQYYAKPITSPTVMGLPLQYMATGYGNGQFDTTVAQNIINQNNGKSGYPRMGEIYGRNWRQYYQEPQLTDKEMADKALWLYNNGSGKVVNNVVGIVQPYLNNILGRTEPMKMGYDGMKRQYYGAYLANKLVGKGKINENIFKELGDKGSGQTIKQNDFWNRPLQFTFGDVNEGFKKNKNYGNVSAYDFYDFHQWHDNPKSIPQYAENFATWRHQPGFPSSITLTPDDMKRFDNEYNNYLKRRK